MKEIIEKSKVYHDNFLKSLHKSQTSITDKNPITAEFNEFFVNVGSKLDDKISSSEKHFERIFQTSPLFFAKNL